MKFIKTVLLSVVSAVLVSCGTTSTVPITGRTRTLLVSDDQVVSMASQQYREYMQSAKVSTDAANTALVKRVGQKLAATVENYLTTNGLTNELQYYSWEFNLVNDQQVNAWCMPGGKIVVYEGILPVTQDETSLAIVLGHEIAHAVAKHSAEQMSTALKQQYSGQALSMVLSGLGVSSGWQNVASLGWSMTTKGFSAKYSRDNESEADHLGIIFAAMAGYDPQAAITFWQRMSAATGGGSTSWLSSHPSDATRISQIEGWMPEAMRYYQAPAAQSTNATNTANVTNGSHKTNKANGTNKTNGSNKNTKTFHIK